VGSGVLDMRLTNTYTRFANVPDFGEAQELYEQVAHEFYQLMAKVEHLADLLGLTPEEVFQEIQEDFLGGGKIASTRSATLPMRMDAGELREHLAHELHQWQVEGSRSPDWVRSFWVKVKHLAKMIGKTKEEVHQELQEDAGSMEDEEDLDLGRTSAKAVNPWAVCHSQLGPEKNEKFERCVQDVKKKSPIKKD
jgi:hypothetical protein